MHQPAADPDLARRRELGAFLRSQREARSPTDVGLRAGGRRRTPGLRREELAALAGVSTTWLTWVEQARDVQASERTVLALARALALTPQETDYLARLARRSDGRLPRRPATELDPSLRRYVERAPHPAYATGRLFSLLAWNGAAEALMAPFSCLPPERRNFLRFYFLDGAHRERAIGWEGHARLLVAKFRALYAKEAADADAAALLAELRAESPEFATWWEERDVNWVSVGGKRYRTADGGVEEYEFFIFQPDLQSDIRICQLIPV